jgi:hypothetical protein
MSRWKLVFGLLAVCLMATGGMVQAQKINVVVISPRNIADALEYDGVTVVDTLVVRQSSSGLSVAGVGEQVYLRGDAGDLTGTPTWSVVGPTGSTAALVAAATGDLMSLTPDMVGTYTVSMAVGDTTVTQTITGAKYLGADGCKMCHSTKHEEWLGSGHADML